MEESLVRLEPSSIPVGLHALFNRLERHRSGGQQADEFIEEVFHTMKEDLGLLGVLVYGERRDGFELRRRVGEGFEALDRVPGRRVVVRGPRSCSTASTSSRTRTTTTPRRASASSRAGPSAAVVVGRRPKRYVLFFFASTDGWVREELDFALNTVRAALGSPARGARAPGSLEQAAEIQQSLLLEEPPAFAGLRPGRASCPAEEVGGDFFDFVRLRRGHAGPRPSATPAGTACPRRCSCATW